MEDRGLPPLAQNCCAENPAFVPEVNWIGDRFWVPHSSGCAFQPEGWETSEAGIEVARDPGLVSQESRELAVVCDARDYPAVIAANKADDVGAAVIDLAVEGKGIGRPDDCAVVDMDDGMD
jgi:hypothetical protein